MALSIAEQIIYSTVKITALAGSSEIGTGTGFFWGTLEGGGTALSLVTNKHVIQGANAIRVSCHLATSASQIEPSGSFTDLTLALDPIGMVEHPNPAIDIVSISFSGPVLSAEKNGLQLFLRSFTAANVPSVDDWQNFDAIEEVLMVGCPRGITDEVNNHPIVRRGITATQLGKNYNGKPEFVVDMACFPGSSGSPVVMSQSSYTNKAGGTVVGGRFFVLGILYEGPIISNSGVITFGNAPKVEVASMMHLGNVVKATELLAIDTEIRKRLKAAVSTT